MLEHDYYVLKGIIFDTRNSFKHNMVERELGPLKEIYWGMYHPSEIKVKKQEIKQIAQKSKFKIIYLSSVKAGHIP